MKREEQIRIQILKEARDVKPGSALLYHEDPVTVSVAQEMLYDGLLTGSENEYGMITVTAIRDEGLAKLKADERLERFDKTRHVNIYAKGEVFSYLEALQHLGQIKDCVYLGMTQGGHGQYKSTCDKDWLSGRSARNVPTDMTAYHHPSSYSWPSCPVDCPHYLQADDFLGSVTEEVQDVDEDNSMITYVDFERIEELKRLPRKDYDLTRLVRLCEELNAAHLSRSLLAIPMLVRAVLDHIPPVFEQPNFKSVTSQHGPQSFKDHMSHLDNSLRKIADTYLHTQIRAREALPSPTQVDFRSDLDVLLQEVVRLLKE